MQEQGAANFGFDFLNYLVTSMSLVPVVFLHVGWHSGSRSFVRLGKKRARYWVLKCLTPETSQAGGMSVMASILAGSGRISALEITCSINSNSVFLTPALPLFKMMFLS